MSGYLGLLLLCSARFGSADLRMASQPKHVGYRLRDTGSVPWNVTAWTPQWHYRYMEPSTFGYKGLEHQKARNYDNFLRSNIDNEQDNRDFNKEDGKDHLPFRSYESEVFDNYLWEIGQRNRVEQVPENLTLTKVVKPGDPLMVPFRWNNPHASEMEVNIWIFEHAGKQPVVVPIRKPSCSGEGYQNNIIHFTIPTDFTDLGGKIPGFKGCSETAKPMCTLQIYSHSVESRTYASGFPIVIPGHKESLTASDNKGIKAASDDPWLDLSLLRDTCLPANDPSANIPTAEPRWARLVSDVYTHSYQNSDYSAYSGQQHESISKNLQASAINKMEVGNRGELGKNYLPRDTYNRLRHLRGLEDRIYKNYEALANKIIRKVGPKMYNTGTIGIQRTATCFRCKETGSTKNQRIETNTYIPSFQLVTTDSDECFAGKGQIKAAGKDLKPLTSIKANTRFVPLISWQGEDYPVCGHYFWDNDYGATTVCKALGFTYGRRVYTRAVYEKDAMPVGRCGRDQPLTACSYANNAYGVLDAYNGYCKAGNRIGVEVYCSGGSSSNYKTVSEKGTCENVLAEANALVPKEYAQLVSDTGLVQIYVSALKDLMPFFYESRHLGIIYQDAIVKTSITTLSDTTKFKKIDASGKVDGGKYATLEAKKTFVANRGCPSHCLYAQAAHPKGPATKSGKKAIGMKNSADTTWALPSETRISGPGMEEAKLVGLKLNLEKNLWIIGMIDGSLLKMFKIKITSESDYEMVAAKSQKEAAASCLSQATFTEDCLTGTDVGLDEYKIVIPNFIPAPGEGQIAMFAGSWYCVVSSTTNEVKGPYPDLLSAKIELNKTIVNRSFRQQICEMTQGGAKNDPRQIGSPPQYQTVNNGFQTSAPSGWRDYHAMNNLCNRHTMCRNNGVKPVAARTSWYCVASKTKKTVSGPYPELTMAKIELNKTLANKTNAQLICEMTEDGVKHDYEKVGGQYQLGMNGFQSSWPRGHHDMREMWNMCNANDDCRYNGATPAANPYSWFCVGYYKSSIDSYVKGPYSDISEAKEELNKNKQAKDIYQQICEMGAYGAKRDPHKVGGQNQGAGPMNGFETSWPRGWGSINHLNNMCNLDAPCKLNVPRGAIEKPLVQASLGTNVSGECAACAQFFGKKVHTIKKPKATKLALKVAEGKVPKAGVGSLSVNPDDEPHTPGRRRRRSASVGVSSLSANPDDEPLPSRRRRRGSSSLIQKKSNNGKKRESSYKLIGDFLKRSEQDLNDQDLNVAEIKVLKKVKPLPVADDSY